MLSLLGIQFQFPRHPACSITTHMVFHLCVPVYGSKVSNFSQMSYCRIHTSKITHLRGSVNAFPAVQAPMFLQISCICNINPQVLHLNGLSPKWRWLQIHKLVYLHNVPLHTLQWEVLSISAVLFLEPPMYTIANPIQLQHFVTLATPLCWMNGDVVLCSPHHHVTTCTFLSATTSPTSSKTCYLDSDISTICHYSIHLLKTVTLYKLSNTLLVFPSIIMVLEVEIHTTWITKFVMDMDLLGLAILTMHATPVTFRWDNPILLIGSQVSICAVRRNC
jgi:hypothetical protein